MEGGRVSPAIRMIRYTTHYVWASSRASPSPISQAMQAFLSYIHGCPNKTFLNRPHGTGLPHPQPPRGQSFTPASQLLPCSKHVFAGAGNASHAQPLIKASISKSIKSGR